MREQIPQTCVVCDASDCQEDIIVPLPANATREITSFLHGKGWMVFEGGLEIRDYCPMHPFAYEVEMPMEAVAA